MRMRRGLFLCLLAFAIPSFSAGPDPHEIVRRSIAASEANWQWNTAFSFLERDVNSKGGSGISKTYRVLMIEGSPYERLIAVNDVALSPAQEEQERLKLEREIAQRRKESPAERAKRIAHYEKEQDRDHNLIREMARAFDYKLRGEERLDGRDVLVLEATPRPGFQPASRDTRVLTGMRGTLWIDKKDYQWVKAEAEVIKPVTFAWFLAKVSPGTRFLLEQGPVSGKVWMPKHFRIDLNETVLWRQKSYTEDETYQDYRPASQETVAKLKP